MDRHLDPHCEAIMEEYRKGLPQFEAVAREINFKLRRTFDQAGLLVAAIEYRVKSEDSLAGKLELKGAKYKTLADITDIIGLRVITFYIDDVDKVASAVERLFSVDWENSVDKRKIHEIDSFGYLSLHYICSQENFPYRFEIQMRTVLQHAWANMNHDTGYKSFISMACLMAVMQQTLEHCVLPALRSREPTQCTKPTARGWSMRASRRELNHCSRSRLVITRS